MSPIYLEDMHVHSTFSDGRGSVAENIAVAASRGLTRFCCVDHVREDTMWVPAFVAEVARCSLGRSMSVYAGIEAKILDDEGTLDAPPEVDWVDFVYAADHQVPWRGGCRKPQDVRRDVQLGKVTRIRVIETLVEATARVLERYDRVVLAHLFSVLPKVTISEDEVPLTLIDALASVAARRKASIEIDERWRCPSPRVVSRFLRAGVPVLLSTDSHRPEDIGRYRYAIGALAQAGIMGSCDAA